MKRINILYWVFNVLLAILILSSAIPNIISSEGSKDIFRQLGYPEYLVPFLGIAKAVASICILVPGLKRIKEWAYAGILFDLLGATFSIGKVMGASGALPMLLFLGMFALAYYFHLRRDALPAATKS